MNPVIEMEIEHIDGRDKDQFVFDVDRSNQRTQPMDQEYIAWLQVDDDRTMTARLQVDDSPTTGWRWQPDNRLTMTARQQVDDNKPRRYVDDEPSSQVDDTSTMNLVAK